MFVDFRTELEVSTPYLKTKRTREDAIPKKEKLFFNPHFPRQSVNCYCQDSRGCCEYRLPEKSRRSLYFPDRNRVTMQARSGELWWSNSADDSYSSSLYLLQNMWHYPEDAFSVFSQHSIDIIDMKWGTSIGHVTLSQKMRLALPVSIPASCFFYQQAVIWDFRTERKISRQSLSISEHCKKTAQHTKWLCLLQPFSSCLYIWPYWHQVSYFHACRGQIYQF